MNLFQLGDFALHSGKKSRWKIDCDTLTDEDYETLAWVVAMEWNLEYNGVKAIERGGHILAEKLRQYQQSWTKGINTLLILDDVLTSGRSIEEVFEAWKDAKNIRLIGVVIFARGKCPSWVRPIFQMHNEEAKPHK